MMWGCIYIQLEIGEMKMSGQLHKRESKYERKSRKKMLVKQREMNRGERCEVMTKLQGMDIKEQRNRHFYSVIARCAGIMSQCHAGFDRTYYAFAALKPDLA